MRCLTYALLKHIKHGGYLCIRKCRTIPFLPHFIWAKELGECEQMTTDRESRGMWKELWYTITGQHYRIKKGDE
jgi:hypothetical protein